MYVIGHAAGLGSGLLAQAQSLLDGATDDAIPLYERRGWTQWRGPLSAMTASGIVRTPDEAGGVYVLTAGASIDIESELTCDWRDGDLW